MNFVTHRPNIIYSLYSGVHMETREEAEGSPYDVIVIGAGISGLAAAKHLIDNGCDNLKILEARNRTGGRIHTVKFGCNNADEQCQVAEMGANWIHGKDDNPLYELAKSLDLLQPLIKHSEYDGIYYSECGQPTDKILVEEMQKVFKQTVEEMTELEESDENYSKSSYDFLEKRLSDLLSVYKDAQRDEARNIFHCLLHICKEDCGDDLQSLSLQECGFEDDFKNDNFLLPKGLKYVLKYFETCSVDKIDFETKVEVIDWTERTDKDGRYVTVVCNKDGIQRIYKAHYVLSTLPLGVLKSSHTTMFKPMLTDSKVKAIENLGFGKVNKILLYYRNPFWTPGVGGIKLVWKHGKPPIFSTESWAKNLTAFKEMKFNPNLLVAWVCGQGAQEVETVSLSEISSVCTTVLRHFLQNASIPKPDNVAVSKWCSDPFCRGAYTYIKKSKGADDVYALAEPMNDANGRPCILFAGEATDRDSYASMHGAMISGVREGTRILSVWRENKSKY